MQIRKHMIEALENRDLLAVDVFPDESVNVRSLQSLDEKVFVDTWGDEVLIVDTTSGEVSGLADLSDSLLGVEVASFSGNVELSRTQDRMYFYTEVNDRFQLWTTGGTSPTTELLLDSETPLRTAYANPKTDVIVVAQYAGSGEVNFFTSKGTTPTTKQALDESASGFQVGEDGLISVTKDDAGELYLVDSSEENGLRLIHRSEEERRIHPHAVRGDLVFFSLDAGRGRESYRELYAYDLGKGTTELIVGPTTLNGFPGFEDFNDFTILGEDVYFTGLGSRHLDSQIWKTKGTIATTASIASEELQADHLFTVGDRLLFYSHEDTGLWTLDDEQAPIQIGDFGRAVHSLHVTPLGDEALIDFGGRGSLLKTDGTSEGTLRFEFGNALHASSFGPVEDVHVIFNPRGGIDSSAYAFRAGQDEPERLPIPGDDIQVVFPTPNGALVFSQDRGENDTTIQTVYTTDGTNEGTYLLDEYESSRRLPLRKGIATNDAFFLRGQLGDASTLVRIDLSSRGDVNRDGDLTPEDIDLVFAAIKSGETNEHVDVDASGQTTVADVTQIVEFHAQTMVGDLNFDRRVDFADFLQLSANIGTTENARWSDGDLNGNGSVTFDDFMLLSENFGFNAFGNE